MTDHQVQEEAVTLFDAVTEIRAARPSDAEATVAIVRRSITELCVADHKNDPLTLAKWLQNKTPEIFTGWIQNESNFCVVAVDGGHVSGVALVKRDGEISLFYLAPGAQRRGIGTSLHAALEEKARAWGLARLRLGSTRGACCFYESLGYISTGPAQLRFGVLHAYPHEKLLQSTTAARSMRFDIYGRHQLDVVREDKRWKVYEVSTGTRVPRNDVIIPPDVDEAGLSTFLDDLFHELARPGQTIRRID